MESNAATIWLAIIAIATLAQALVVVGLAVVTYRMSRALSDQLARLERDVVRPLSRQASTVADELREAIARVRSVDDDVRHVLRRGAALTSNVTRVMQDRMWPALGLTRGIFAAVASLRRAHQANVSRRGRGSSSAELL
jgi:hypothetical protein